MIEFIIGYITGVEFLDRAADFGALVILGLIAGLCAWLAWDRVRFTRRDALDEKRIMGAYTGDTSLEPATHAISRRRSPFSRPRP